MAIPVCYTDTRNGDSSLLHGHAQWRFQFATRTREMAIPVCDGNLHTLSHTQSTDHDILFFFQSFGPPGVCSLKGSRTVQSRDGYTDRENLILPHLILPHLILPHLILPR